MQKIRTNMQTHAYVINIRRRTERREPALKRLSGFSGIGEPENLTPSGGKDISK